MNLDQFAFVNHQLAGMLRAGIPLEGALRQTCQTMSTGSLRAELDQLGNDLSRGTPLREALSRRRLPTFYTRLLEIGAQSGDLPALLTLLADYYQRLHLTWVRIKGLIFYPTIVLVTSFAVSLLIALMFGHFIGEILNSYGEGMPGANMSLILVGLWIPVAVLLVFISLLGLILFVPRWREAVQWRLPGFREARLSHFASSLSLLLQNGSSPSQAIALVRQLEANSPAARELGHWQERLARGQTRFEDLAAGGKVFPPLFIWLVSASRENWVEGFRHAADVFYERAVQRTEVILYAVLPISVLFLGCLIIGQLAPMISVLGKLGQHLTNFGDL